MELNRNTIVRVAIPLDLYESLKSSGKILNEAKKPSNGLTKKEKSATVKQAKAAKKK